VRHDRTRKDVARLRRINRHFWKLLTLSSSQLSHRDQRGHRNQRDRVTLTEPRAAARGLVAAFQLAAATPAVRDAEAGAASRCLVALHMLAAPSPSMPRTVLSRPDS